MLIKFQTTADDYKKFLSDYFFKWNLARRLLLYIMLAVLISSIGEKSQTLNLSTLALKTCLALIFIFIILVLAPYLIALFKFKKSFKTNSLKNPVSFEINDEGITISTLNENTYWKWESLKNTAIINGCLFFTLINNKHYIIPSHALSGENEALNILGMIKTNIQKVQGGNITRKIRKMHYWGLLGLIPNFGAIAGIILCIKARQYNKLSLLLVGVADILFTVIFWMLITPIISSIGSNDISQFQLNNLLKNVEMYKLQHGEYPDSLPQLLIDDKFAPIEDNFLKNKNKNYYYKKLGNKYLLFSSGQDGIPNTIDDLYPKIKITDSSGIGWIKSN